MTDGDHILRAILDEPHDDLHRLAYADWLEENGQNERAEFIRLQLPQADRPGYNREILNRLASYGRSLRALSLLHRHRREWSGWLGPIFLKGRPADSQASLKVPPIWESCGWERGFVARVTCTLSDWMDYGLAVVAQNPVRQVDLSDRHPHVEGSTFSWTSFPSSLSPRHYADVPWAVPGGMLLPYDKGRDVSFGRLEDAVAFLSFCALREARLLLGQSVPDWHPPTLSRSR